jgi:hypothetical protein
MRQKALVVGAGFGGIAAALRLRKLDYEVLLIDRQDKIGGRAYVYQRNGFTFDAGPTVITAPFLLEELFSLFDRQLSNYVQLVPVDPWYSIRFHTGETFRYGGSLEETLAEIRRYHMSVKVFITRGEKVSVTHYSFIAFLSLFCLLPSYALPAHESGGKSEQSRTNTNKINSQNKSQSSALSLQRGGNAVMLSEADKTIAKSLGYDESVLKLLRGTLNAEFSVKLPPAIDPDATYGVPYHMGELLPQDIANYKQIAKDFPVFASIVGWEIGRFDPTHSASRKAEEDQQLKQFGKEKFARRQRILNAQKPYVLLIQQEELEKKADRTIKGTDYLADAMSALESDQATDAYIAKLKSHFTNVKLKNTQNLKAFLLIKYWGTKGSTRYADPRIADLRVKLQALGYRISEDIRGEEDRKTFVHREDAIKLMEQTGTPIDKLSLNEQKAMKFTAIYPIESADWINPENAKIMTIQSIPDLENAPASSLEQMIKLNQAAALAVKPTSSKAMRGFGQRAIFIPPGSKITNLGNRRWIIDCPARYTASTQRHVASIIKVSKDDVGLALIKTQDTSGINYSVTNQMIQDKVSDWNTRYGVTVTQAEKNTVTLRFKTLPDDMRSLCTEIFLFSPPCIQLTSDKIENLSEMRKFATHLRETSELTLYWD